MPLSVNYRDLFAINSLDNYDPNRNCKRTLLIVTCCTNETLSEEYILNQLQKIHVSVI